MEPLSAANTQFKKISEGNTSRNVFYSPISISSALAMVSLGAKGNTAAQMFKVISNLYIFYGQSPRCPADQIHSSFNKLMSELKKPDAPYVLSLTNRLYGEQSYQYNEAGLEEVDFKKKSDAARVDINKWFKPMPKVENGSIDSMTRLVLVNAIYFKGNWEKKFPKDATRDGQFKLNKTQTKPVKMMNQESKFPLAFIPEMNSQVLELLYVGKNLSMLIILPNEIQDEGRVLGKWHVWSPYSCYLISVLVQISLPRFKMEETYDMKSLLISMGMEDVFDGQKVNLSGMSPNNDLVVTKVIHKAFVEVNEEGTEAAAACIVTMEMCLRIPPVFNADHPFLFFIRHNPTKSILFYGRFCSP
uniref:Serpin B6 n=1 Tax=Sinocyclocheilus grahami TaxID=75366 RepID=A0A672KYR7_SINGR